MNRFTRKLLSLISIAALLLAQLVVSAYACPLQSMGLSEAITNADLPMSDATAPVLCKKHCENGQQNVNDLPQTPAATPTPSALPIEPSTSTTLPAAAFTPSLFHATSPPLAIAHCCFRL